MAFETVSPNMNLVLPGVSQTNGTQWATDLNSSLTIIDSHNHAAGSGVPITPAGMSISSDLEINSNNLTLVRSLRFVAQGSPISELTDLGCLYESGVDLYYNDGNGNQVRITQSGGVAGTPGSISNLTSPASAAYVSAGSTFVWQSAALTPANMDAASYIFRNLVASSYGLTLSPPNAMGANYALTLPSLPASQKFMTLDASGTMGAPWSVDNSTIEVNSNTVQVKNGGITQAKLAVKTTGTTVTAGNVAIAASSGNYAVNESSYVLVTNQTITITTVGSPVYVGLMSDTAGSGLRIAGNGSIDIEVRAGDNTTVLAHMVVQGSSVQFPLPGMIFLDAQSAGSYTYGLWATATAGTTGTINGTQIVAYEL